MTEKIDGENFGQYLARHGQEIDDAGIRAQFNVVVGGLMEIVDGDVKLTRCADKARSADVDPAVRAELKECLSKFHGIRQPQSKKEEISN